MRTLRSTIVVPALSLLLIGCTSLLPEPAPPPSTIDFGPGDGFATMEPLAHGVVLTRVDAPRWLDDTAIPYRQIHRSPNEVKRYAHHVWAAPPPELLAERVDLMLDARGASTQPHPYRLEMRLTRFEQVFTATDEAYIDARMTASLHPPSGDGAHARHTLRVRIDAEPDVGGAIAGLPQAANRLVRELGEWLTGEVAAQ